jgi:hypothetical protein
LRDLHLLEFAFPQAPKGGVAKLIRPTDAVQQPWRHHLLAGHLEGLGADADPPGSPGDSELDVSRCRSDAGWGSPCEAPAWSCSDGRVRFFVYSVVYTCRFRPKKKGLALPQVLVR